MDFCPKCGAILVPKRKNYGCPRCNYTAKDKIKVETKEVMGQQEFVGVVNEKEGEVSPIVDFKCPKCKNEKAYFWSRQMRSSDEAESKFYKCLKCKKVTRVDR